MSATEFFDYYSTHKRDFDIRVLWTNDYSTTSTFLVGGHPFRKIDRAIYLQSIEITGFEKFPADKVVKFFFQIVSMYPDLSDQVTYYFESLTDALKFLDENYRTA